jgi:hypothetical protein
MERKVGLPTPISTTSMDVRSGRRIGVLVLSGLQSGQLLNVKP